MECCQKCQKLLLRIRELEAENAKLAGLVGSLVSTHDRMILELIVTGALQSPGKASQVTLEQEPSET